MPLDGYDGATLLDLTSNSAKWALSVPKLVLEDADPTAEFAGYEASLEAIATLEGAWYPMEITEAEHLAHVTDKNRAQRLLSSLTKIEWASTAPAHVFFGEIIFLRDELIRCELAIPDALIASIIRDNLRPEHVAVAAWLMNYPASTAEQCLTKCESYEHNTSGFNRRSITPTHLANTIGAGNTPSSHGGGGGGAAGRAPPLRRRWRRRRRRSRRRRSQRQWRRRRRRRHDQMLLLQRYWARLVPLCGSASRHGPWASRHGGRVAKYWSRRGRSTDSGQERSARQPRQAPEEEVA